MKKPCFTPKCAKLLSRTIPLAGVVLMFASTGGATVTFSASGLSAKGVDVRFEAQLTISGDILTIQLDNRSPVASLNPDDLLGSFYFDIIDASGIRPDLTYESAVGDIYTVDRNAPDALLQADADIMAVAPGDYAWVFKEMDPSYSPFAGFGLGTVGNSDLGPNGFPGNFTDGMDYAIYRGDVTTRNLENKQPLVKETAMFTLSGVSGFTEADVSPHAAFGLGTAPDSLLGAPEPGSVALLGLGLLALFGIRRMPRCVR